jgi:hypothetical protein
MTGPERTTTDNAKASSTCAAPYLGRSRTRSIPLWEQGGQPGVGRRVGRYFMT